MDLIDIFFNCLGGFFGGFLVNVMWESITSYRKNIKVYKDKKLLLKAFEFGNPIQFYDAIIDIGFKCFTKLLRWNQISLSQEYDDSHNNEFRIKIQDITYFFIFTPYEFRINYKIPIHVLNNTFDVNIIMDKIKGWDYQHQRFDPIIFDTKDKFIDSIQTTVKTILHYFQQKLK